MHVTWFFSLFFSPQSWKEKVFGFTVRQPMNDRRAPGRPNKSVTIRLADNQTWTWKSSWTVATYCWVYWFKWKWKRIRSFWVRSVIVAGNKSWNLMIDSWVLGERGANWLHPPIVTAQTGSEWCHRWEEVETRQPSLFMSVSSCKQYTTLVHSHFWVYGSKEAAAPKQEVDTDTVSDWSDS